MRGTVLGHTISYASTDVSYASASDAWSAFGPPFDFIDAGTVIAGLGRVTARAAHIGLPASLAVAAHVSRRSSAPPLPLVPAVRSLSVAFRSLPAFAASPVARASAGATPFDDFAAGRPIGAAASCR